ncbi:MAG: DNA-directed RNA polymerase subunit beta, partial [Verrucomicrobiota bacterium]|nr:DNA-directed RNA polymerase subunit beta [Verrucomicrobiota bacterium]
MPSKTSERINFGKIKEVITPPNLIEVQNNSYAEFLQSEIDPKKRENLGLQAVFNEVFPIESYDGKCVLEFSHYEIGEPKLDWLECLREGVTFGAPLHVIFRLRDEQGTKEEKVFMGELPLITPQGSFVINGAERVIVSQLHRSPGLAFEATQHPNGKTMHSFRIIPDRGSWYEAQFDTNDLLFVYLDRKKRRRKFLTTTFFRALGYGSDADILRLFYDIQEVTVKAASKMDDIQNRVLIEDVLDLDKGAVVARAFEPLSAAVVREIANLGLKKIKVVDTSVDEGIIIKCLKKDPT